jgi:phospholipid N-methyltransferase
VAPSSPRLAKAMCDHLGPVPAGGVIVELGPGTGPFTRELRRRHPGHRLVVIEANPIFARRLARELPEVTVIEGCASLLGSHLARLGIACEKVGVIVSGLPLLSLPGGLPNAILTEIAAVLKPGRRYVQFTYSARSWRRLPTAGLTLEPPRKVWLNLPPATVLPFVRT